MGGAMRTEFAISALRRAAGQLADTGALPAGLRLPPERLATAAAALASV
jgi:hypothetical protein